MGTSKSLQFSESQNRKADLYKALGHPARIAIIEFLIGKNSCVCGDIVGELPLSQSTISQHLAALKQVGIIKGEVEGVKTCYCIDENVLNELNEMTINLKSSYSVNKCC